MTIIDTSKDLAALFSQQVERTPNLPALEDQHISYTYAELDVKVTELSKVLRSYGVGRDSLVGVLLPRSADYVIACLAALRAGGAFLVLEVAYPSDLLHDVLEDAKPTVVLTKQTDSAKVGDGFPIIAVDQAFVQGSAEQSPLPSTGDLSRLAFVSYSSGTTGKPKGIANPHSAPVLSYDLRFALRDVQPGDRVACNVFFIWEIIRPLLRGATVVAVPDEVSYDPVGLTEMLASKRCTETLMTPTLLAAVLSRATNLNHKLHDLRTLWLNGEVVTTDLARRALKALPNVQIFNCYSASETHEIACGNINEILPMLDDDAIYCPVGPPMDAETCYVLDEEGNRLKEGRSGELFVGGPLLARGYLNRPETTAKAFVPDTFIGIADSRMYRTGDLARILPSGLLEIVGRVGSMIKLRGYSVVPGKVESAIIANLAVAHCAVVPHGDGLDRQLIAYIVPDVDISAERPVVDIDNYGFSPQSRRVLSEHLAQYMIPAIWIKLNELPTHQVSGKIDKRALPPPIDYVEPAKLSNGVQGELASELDTGTIGDLWSKSLNLSRHIITTEYTFFDLGGHSLSLADLASRLATHFDIKVPVARLADPATLDGHLQTVLSIKKGETEIKTRDLPLLLKQDSMLDDHITFDQSSTFCSINKARTILLTGVTGFLGAFLLHDLWKTSSAQLICLVRSKECGTDAKVKAVAKIRTHMLEMGIWSDAIAQRIDIVLGDLTDQRFGLSESDFADLAKRVDVVVHSAATVNLVYPYSALRKANVEGTREILRLAAAGKATVQYISTNGVLPPSSGATGWPESAILKLEDVPSLLADGYGQSKWVAEQLVLEAIHRGLPGRVVRIGTIGGHSQLGSNNAWDLLSALIVESICTGQAPLVEGWRYEMTPVDIVSRSIIQLANIADSREPIFHVGDAEPIGMSEVFSILNELGYDTKPVAWNDWVANWNSNRRDSKQAKGLFSTVDVLRGGMPDIEFLQSITVLNTVMTEKVADGLTTWTADKSLLATYTRHWFARGWLTQAPNTLSSANLNCPTVHDGPLSGKVAIVTGASSGIGAAIALALAQEGCNVALAARRLDALEEIKGRLTHVSSKVITRQTDVTSKKQVDELLETVNQDLGSVDILIHCAGVMYFTLMKNAQVEQWDKTVDVNCKGLLYCLAATVPKMLSRGTGHVLAISSDAGRKVFPGLGVYSASKFFVEATLQSLRLETSGTGLRVTSIQPGNVGTDLLSLSTDTEALEKYGAPSGAKVLDVDDVARAVIYALKQPSHVAVNEVLIEPRDEPI